MDYVYTPEQEMEKRLIKLLCEKESQWTYADFKTEDELWDNFFYQLFQNNKDKLKSIPFTESEKLSIKNQLNFSSFYNAAVWLAGENGVAQVELHREDASLGSMQLKVISSKEIAGGQSNYQIINQFKADKNDFQDQDARFDVTLMINGLPLIQIELKTPNEGYMKAFNQIKRYVDTGKYRGIFSAIQMFVVSNGVDTKYIAASEHLNSKFLTGWTDEKNQNVTKIYDFVKNVLTIPEAHQMVSQYSVLDKDHRSIILMRPYQVHAIKAIKAVNDPNSEISKLNNEQGNSGYIWHTTGSGKTLTSYKVARNLLDIPSIDKTIFIIDRIDLDQQTTAAFTSYAEADYVDVEETASVYDLINKLASSSRDMVVTTIQKLNYVIATLEKDPKNKKINKIRDLKVAFVVDECHRAVTPQKQDEIRKFFRKSDWYGFTGTPLFAENARDAWGDLPRTTEQQYGPCLHNYTVLQGIKDGAVLGFQIEYKDTISHDAMYFYLRDELALENVDSLTDLELEAKLPPAVYDTTEHMEEVVNTIINKTQRKFGLENGAGQTYDAILTTSSIDKAIKYYEIFSSVKDGTNPNVKVQELTKRQLIDFPKVAITYSLSDNEINSQNQKYAMAKALDNYNNMFGTSFNLETIKAYNRDLNNRLARKSSKYLSRSEQLDLVIVVDRLLTGFDAPCMSTLFIDRAPMRPHNLIQAFSRTNRIFDKNKQYGQVVTFQTPNIFKKAVDEALGLYSNGGGTEIEAPTFQESWEELIEAVGELRSLCPEAETMNIYNELAEMRKVAKAFQRFDKIFRTIQVYTDFNIDEFVEKYGFGKEELTEYIGAYNNLIERIKNLMIEVDPDLPTDFNLDYEIESVRTDQVDYEYIIMLIDRVRKVKANKEHIKAKNEVVENIELFKEKNPKLAAFLLDFINDVLDNPEIYNEKSSKEIINERIAEHQDKEIKDFANKWFVNVGDLKYIAANYSPSKDEDNEIQTGEHELIDNANYEEYKTNVDKPLNKLKYRNSIRENYKLLIKEEILPYNID